MAKVYHRKFGIDVLFQGSRDQLSRSRFVCSVKENALEAFHRARECSMNRNDEKALKNKKEGKGKKERKRERRRKAKQKEKKKRKKEQKPREWIHLLSSIFLRPSPTWYLEMHFVSLGRFAGKRNLRGLVEGDKDSGINFSQHRETSFCPCYVLPEYARQICIYLVSLPF